MFLKNIIALLFIYFTLVSCVKKHDTPKPLPAFTPSISNFIISTKHLTDSNFKILAPTSNSSGKFTYSSDNPSIAIIIGDSIQIKAIGSVTITATQKATGKYKSGTIAAIFTVLPDVYITGYASTPNGYQAAYWKNGNITILNGEAIAHDIFVKGKDVYVAGEIVANGQFCPGYWKNGVQTIFSSPGEAMGVVVSGNDIYVAGSINTNDPNGDYIATLWKNGIATKLKDIGNCCGRYFSSKANGIAIKNNEVYICGLSGVAATVWKEDGSAVALSNTLNGIQYSSSYAISIKFSGNDVYVTGLMENGLTYLTYWKNNIPTILTSSSAYFSGLYSIALQGSDIYAVGIDGTSAGYWKNGIKQILPPNAGADRIAIQGNDIYLLGETFNSDYTIRTPLYWLNGTAVYLPGLYNAYVTAITIIDK